MLVATGWSSTGDTGLFRVHSETEKTFTGTEWSSWSKTWQDSARRYIKSGELGRYATESEAMAARQRGLDAWKTASPNVLDAERVLYEAQPHGGPHGLLPSAGVAHDLPSR